MGNIFEKQDPVLEACKSDSIDIILKAIGNDLSNYEKAVKYLTGQGNLSIALRVMVRDIPGKHKEDILPLLLLLEPKDAPKVERLSADGQNPIHLFAVVPGLSTFIRVLAHSEVNLDIKDSVGRTPLLLACEAGNYQGAEMLINNGARDLDSPDATGWTPLHYACQLGNLEIVNLLISNGAKLSPISKDGVMPIHVAISTMQMAQMSPTAPNGQPWSAQGAFKCVAALANHGADLNYKCAYGFSAFEFLLRIGAIKKN